MGKRTITISDELYARLQAHAIPLEDTIETVIARLCDAQDRMMVAADSHQHMMSKAARLLGYDSAAALYTKASDVEASRRRLDMAAALGEGHAGAVTGVAEAPAPAGEGPRTFRTSRSIYLPVGAKLMGEYQGQQVYATVQVEGIQFEGEHYENPSSAAVAAKKRLGASEKAAQTNGWQFWQIEMHPGMGMWQPLDVLRERQSHKRAGDDS